MIDTGAEANIILENQVTDKIRHLTKTHIQLQPYGSKLIIPKGEFTAHTHWRDKKCKSTWIVVDDDDLPEKPINLVSCNLTESLGIITNTPSMEIKGSLINSMGTKTASTDDANELTKSVRPPIGHIITQHPSIFHGLGKMKAEPIQLHIKPNASPVIQPPRPIPYHLKDTFDDAIHIMEADDVIEPHHGPVTWLSNPVLVPKADGSMRVIVDLRNLNKALQDTHLPISGVDDTMPMFTGKSIFSKLDLKTAFHQLELSEASRILTVFLTGDRLMRHKRLTMRTLPASGELNSWLCPIITNIPNAAVIQDDIVVATADKETHYQMLEAVITALEKAVLTVSPSKCILGLPEIPFSTRMG